MSNRRKSREFALQALFGIDITEEYDHETVEAVCRMLNVPETLQPYFFDVVKGVSTHYKGIDQCIGDTSSNWKLSRMSPVDRNIIRIAAYEILYKDDIPPKVAINEAIEIGKKFGTEKSGSFINGILDTLYKHFPNRKPQRDPQ